MRSSILISCVIIAHAINFSAIEKLDPGYNATGVFIIIFGMMDITDLIIKLNRN